MKIDQADPAVNDLVEMAQRLRKVRAASRQFLALWALEKALDKAPAPEPGLEALLSDPDNHDWSLLYKGSVLDD
jgi:hypothetical protein